MHWYNQQGEACYTITGQNGKERDTNLRDARKIGLVPSVTTVLNVLAKPGLEFWKINQAINSALTLPWKDNVSQDIQTAKIRTDAKEIGKQAAEEGTRIHDALEKSFNGEKVPKKYLDLTSKVKNDVYNYFGTDIGWVAEASFAHKNGYGGKVDLSNSALNVVLDFKTKEAFKRTKIGVVQRMAYDEHCMQLAAYSEGLGFKNPSLINLFVEYTGSTMFHAWKKKDIERCFKMFNTCLELWKLQKKYDCGWEEK